MNFAHLVAKGAMIGGVRTAIRKLPDPTGQTQMFMAAQQMENIVQRSFEGFE